MIHPATPRARAALTALWPDCGGRLVVLHGGSDAAVFRLQDAGKRAVVKVWDPQAADKATAQVTRQIAVANAMTSRTNRAAQVLHWAADGPAVVMEDAGQHTARDAAPLDPIGTLRRAGQWVEAFHATTLRPHPFRPAGHINHLQRLVAQGDSGARAIVDFDQFKAAAQRVADQGMALRGRPAHRCVTHRDLTLSNLVKDPSGALIGIDFENAKEDDPLRDIIALTMDCVPLAPETGIHRLFMAASGDYGPSLADRDVRLFMQRVFALGYWARTPPDGSVRRQMQQAAAVFALHATRPFV